MVCVITAPPLTLALVRGCTIVVNLRNALVLLSALAGVLHRQFTHEPQKSIEFGSKPLRVADP
jgi:hypothetical protein